MGAIRESELETTARGAPPGDLDDPFTTPVAYGSGPVRRADSTARRVADRYELHQVLGRGGSATVWSATDTLSGARVAVKITAWASPVDAARLRREVAALRLLRVPGVVRLLDEGIDHDETFLVMEEVEGTRFPGVPTPAPWERIAPTALSLLETLSRVHAAGVVHRDLKPSNVMVTPGGRPVLLDFGIALGADLSRVTLGHEVVGTPLYLAPEQVTGEAVTPRSDLYSFGVMLFEALAGRPPVEIERAPAMLFSRVFRDAPSLRSIAPDVPEVVALVVDRLLARSPEQRPVDAREVLGRLLGAVPADDGHALPWAGPRRPVDALIDAVREGRSADVVGVPGSGATRCLLEAAGALQGDGYTVVTTRPARAPFASLAALLPSPPDGVTLATLRALVVEALDRALEGRAVLLVDDVEGVDAESARAIGLVRTRRPVLRALRPAHPDAPHATALEPLSADDLTAFVAAPERLLHVRSDAARLLWSCAGGRPGSVRAEIAAWIDAGFGRRDGALLAIDRDELERLDEVTQGRSIARPKSAAGSLPPPPSGEMADFHQCVLLAWPHTEVPLLARAYGAPAWQVEALLGELVAHGAARALEDGRTEPLRPSWQGTAWRAEAIRALHRSLGAALPRGTEGRLGHLLKARPEGDADVEEVLHESEALARARATSGRLDAAQVALADGLTVLRERADGFATLRLRLLSTWVEIAFADGRPQVMNRALYELCRAASADPGFQALEALARASLARETSGPRALALAEAIAPFDDVSIERCRQGLRLSAARLASVEREEGVLASIAPWAEAVPSPDVAAAYAGWRARLSYRQHRFASAAALRAEAAAQAPWLTTRTEHTVAGASAWMEAGDHDRAIALAEQGRDMARQCRHAVHEARAEWVWRSARYRRGERIAPDAALVEAVETVGVADMVGLVTMTEAACAWREGDEGLARRLALRSAEVWQGKDAGAVADLMRALAMVCGQPSSDDERRALRARCAGAPLSWVRAQALALVGAWEEVPARGALLADGGPDGCQRREVLSRDEVLEGLRGRWPESAPLRNRG